jgi:hypothetical protein
MQPLAYYSFHSARRRRAPAQRLFGIISAAAALTSACLICCAWWANLAARDAAARELPIPPAALVFTNCEKGNEKKRRRRRITAMPKSARLWRTMSAAQKLPSAHEGLRVQTSHSYALIFYTLDIWMVFSCGYDFDCISYLIIRLL